MELYIPVRISKRQRKFTTRLNVKDFRVTKISMNVMANIIKFNASMDTPQSLKVINSLSMMEKK